MKMINFKNKILNIVILLSILMLSSTSCNKYDVSIDADDKTVSSTSYSKYIINTRSGKVHTYEHGKNIIENKDYEKESNDSLENILKNENYDICHTCYAGILVKKEISKENIDLIEKYMRLYDFIKIDEERQDFLMSIFTVSNWYINNVYTYQGGEDTVSQIDYNAKLYASENANDRWKDYKDNYSEKYELKNDKRILPVVYDSSNSPTKLALYECDLFKDKYAKGDNKYTKTGKQTLRNYEKEEITKGYKNYYVVDDCSKFAAAVYYYYINTYILNNSLDKDGYGIDLWTTGSQSFARLDGSIMKKLEKTEKFKLYTLNEIDNYNKKADLSHDEKFDLLPGDLLYRKEEAIIINNNGEREVKTIKPGHVEFYLGNNYVFGWGNIKKGYKENKIYTFTNKGYISNLAEDTNNGNPEPYISIIRFIGG